MSTKRYPWATAGDVNAFFGLMLDNIADLLLTVGLLAAVFHFPTNFALQHMVPGTAVGVLVGDLLFFWMAIQVARRTGRHDVTAMPLGLDTPSTFGMVFFVLGPAFLYAQENLKLDETAAATYAWHIGICAIFTSGIFKLVCACGSNWIRRILPRAGLLGSLAAIALVLISFLPLVEVLHDPIVGFVALALILATLVARIRLPGRLPGALAALLVGGLIYYLMDWTGTLGRTSSMEFAPREALLPTGWFSVFRFQWLAAFQDSLRYLPIVIPFALATVVGGIDCTESAAAAGDDFNTNRVIGVEAFATLVASLCGGVIQTTPYIGHPAYKAMGGRAAYVLATALFVGGAGLVGYFGFLYAWIPKATVFPILIFVGLEITAQSFQATPRRHYAAVVLACVPALAALVTMSVDEVLGDPAILGQGIDAAALNADLRDKLHIVRMLANGFIVTSLLWASALVMMIEHRLRAASLLFVVASCLTLFGIIHSPLADGRMFAPWRLAAETRDTPLRFALGYLLIGLMFFGWDAWLRKSGVATEPANVEEPGP